MPKNNLAYDFSRFEQDRKKSEEKKKAQIQVVEKPARQASPVKVIAVLLAVLTITGAMIYSQVVLTELNDKCNVLSEQLAELESESIRKTTQLESMMSLKNIEEYATETLGLVELDQSQIEYVDLSGGDKIEVKKETDQGVWESIQSAFQNLLEYLQ